MSTSIPLVSLAVLSILAGTSTAAESQDRTVPRTRVSIREGRWFLNDEITYRGAKAEGLLMNVRMVNAVFEDRIRPDFDPNANTERFIARIPDYVAHGVRAFTVCLQGGSCGYEGAVNSAFQPDGSLRDSYLQRVRRVIEACDRSGAVVILGCYLPAAGSGAPGRGRGAGGRGQRGQVDQGQRFHQRCPGDRQRIRPQRFRPSPAEDPRRHRRADRLGQADLRRRCWCPPAVWAMAGCPTAWHRRAISC